MDKTSQNRQLAGQSNSGTFCRFTFFTGPYQPALCRPAQLRPTHPSTSMLTSYFDVSMCSQIISNTSDFYIELQQGTFPGLTSLLNPLSPYTRFRKAVVMPVHVVNYRSDNKPRDRRNCKLSSLLR